MKNTSILFLVGAVIVIGAIGYAVTRKAPVTAPADDVVVTEEGDDAMMPTEDATDGSMEETDATDDAAAAGGIMLEGSVTTDAAGAAADVDTSMEADIDPDLVTIEVSGTNFAFDKEVIRVKEGQTVRVVFTSESGFHDWVVDEFSAATAQVQTGGVTEVTFVADKKGSFEYYCSVGAHRANGMVGQLIVE